MLALLSLCVEVLGGTNLSLSVDKADDDGLKLQLLTEEPNNTFVQQLTGQNEPEGRLIGNLMAIFISTYHFGGQVEIAFEADKLCAIKIHFSSNQHLQKLENNDWIEDIFILHSDL